MLHIENNNRMVLQSVGLHRPVVPLLHKRRMIDGFSYVTNIRFARRAFISIEKRLSSNLSKPRRGFTLFCRLGAVFACFIYFVNPLRGLKEGVITVFLLI
jgi:hypothetical protein